MLSCRYAQQIFSPDNFPQSSRMQRVHFVAQYAVFDTSSAAMTANSRGLNPHLIQLPTLTLSYPSISTFQAAVGLYGAETVPDVYFPGLNPFDLIKKRRLRHPNTPASCKIHRQQVQGATSDPWRLCGGLRYLEYSLSVLITVP